MIHIKDFGWRLGNQLFQIAAATGLAEENMDSALVPDDWKYAKYFDYTFNTFNLDPVLGEQPIWQEPAFHYVKIPYQRDLAIQGYFQSEKYFKSSEKLIRKMFSLKNEFVNTKFKSEKITCGIHVRRTDYLDPKNKPFFFELSMENYYNQAIELIKTRISSPIQFLIFSDDLDWCKENFPNTEDFIIAGSPDEIADFSAIMECDNFIMGNSTFSWWACYLNKNPNKTIICPNQQKWFGPALSHYSTQDLIPEGWIRL